jgi:hypothetical protein
VELLQALSLYAIIARLNADGVHPVASRKTRALDPLAAESAQNPM